MQEPGILKDLDPISRDINGAAWNPTPGSAR